MLLVAFTVVNLILAFALWGPEGEMITFNRPSARSQLVQLRTTLDERGLILPSGVTVPDTPGPMRFLRVEYQPDPEKPGGASELSKGGTDLPDFMTRFDPTTRETTLEPLRVPSSPAVDPADRTTVRQVAEAFLQEHQFLPADARFSGIFAAAEGAVVEFAPHYQGLPVYSGYLRVYLTPGGVERVVKHWVAPVGYKEGPAKAVRPAAEALLRLAGRLEQEDGHVRTILDVQLGYYSGPSVTVSAADEISAWETVPVWRITLDNGLVYYVNAFNGELES